MEVTIRRSSPSPYFEGLMGGGNGLSLPTLDATVPIYYVMGVTAAAATVGARLIIGPRFDLRLMTIRGDDVAAEAMGMPTFRRPDIAGALTARDQGYIEPLSVFPVPSSAQSCCSSRRRWCGRSLHPSAPLRRDHRRGRARDAPGIVGLVQMKYRLPRTI